MIISSKIKHFKPKILERLSEIAAAVEKFLPKSTRDADIIFKVGFRAIRNTKVTREAQEGNVLLDDP